MKTFFKTILKVGIFYLGFIIVNYYFNIEEITGFSDELDKEIFPLIAVIIFSLILFFIEKAKVRVFGIHRVFFNIFMGLLFGLLLSLVPIYLLKYMEVLSFFGKESIEIIYINIIVIVLNVITQELLFRGYSYQIVKKEYGTICAIIVSILISLIFNYQFLLNGIVPLISFIAISILMCSIIEYTDSLLSVILIHSIFNIVGILIFNVVISTYDFNSIYKVSFSGKEIYTGGNLMLEGSVVTAGIALVLLVIILVLWSNKKEDKKNDYLYKFNRKNKEKAR